MSPDRPWRCRGDSRYQRRPRRPQPELRYRPAAEIDQARFLLWTQQLRVDAAAKDLAGVTGDVAVLEWTRDRIAHTLDSADRSEINARLRALRAATDAGNPAAAADQCGATRRSAARPRAGLARSNGCS